MSGLFLSVWVLWFGCSVDLAAGLDDQIRQGLAPCVDLPDETRDWCVKGLIASSLKISGADAAIICGRMKDTDAADACREAAVELVAPHAPAEICDEIRDQTLRESCFQGVADRLSKASAPVEEVVAACIKTESLRESCLMHMLQRRLDFYEEQGGVSALEAEMVRVLAFAPQLSDSKALGRSAAMAARTMDRKLRGVRPCPIFSNGAAKVSCMEKRQQNAYWTYLTPLARKVRKLELEQRKSGDGERTPPPRPKQWDELGGSSAGSGPGTTAN